MKKLLLALALPVALLVALLWSAPSFAAGFKARGFTLPDGAVKVDDDRYRLPQSWDDAVRFYRTVYPAAKFPRKTLHSQSQVRAVNIGNPSGGEWEGANMYESANGEVRIFVLSSRDAREPGAEEKPPKKP